MDQFFYEIFDPSLPRLGPGENVYTKKAFEMLLDGPAQAETNSIQRILDVGCGNGGATIQLAQLSGGEITALDNHGPFLDELNRRAGNAGVAGKIKTCLQDMNRMEFGEGSFDLIWSEGALSLMGLREGLCACHRLLAPGGLMAVSDLAWFRPDAPPECVQFFQKVYPAIAGIEENLTVIQECGFIPMGNFSLPESAWWNCYQPLENRLKLLREKYPRDEDKLKLIGAIEHEIEIYRRNSAWYGYEFFLMRRG